MWNTRPYTPLTPHVLAMLGISPDIFAWRRLRIDGWWMELPEKVFVPAGMC